ncbi:MAG: mechanosensitive ion channel [Bdellovibrionales bacterium]|nr:mechanosensitive ion channel [Bdellovibrionales bacterium]
MDEFFPRLFVSLNNLNSTVLFNLGQTPITLGKIVLVSFAIWFFYFLSIAIEGAIHRTLARKDIDPGMKEAIERFTRYGVFTMGVLITMAYMGINLRSLETFGAVLGVGIGFGLQNITQNFISGIILLTERPIKRGDIVDVGGNLGRVLDIRARSTLVLTQNDVVIVVPNSEFITKPVINQSFTGNKTRYIISINVSSSNDLQFVKQTLIEIAARNTQVLKTPPPSVIFKNFADTKLEFGLAVWLDELWFSDMILSDLRFEIDRVFKEKQINLPSGNLDINIKSLPKDKKVNL